MVGFSLVVPSARRAISPRLPTAHLMLTKTGNNKSNYKEKVNVL